MKTLLRVLIAIVTAGLSHAAAAECPELAKVAWWTNTVPEVRETVKASFQGNWDKYIARWQRYRGDLQTEYDGHGTVRIKSHDVEFRGEDLKTYIATVDTRIATLECLKRDIADAEVATFATAAGGPQTNPPQEEAKAVEKQELSVDVSASCRNGLAVFQVTNLGNKWPRLGEISLYRTDTNGMLSQRRVRMIEAQEMSITVPADVARGAGEVGLYIEPAWYPRKFEYDARVSC
jgi:hypothetical protein